MNNADDHNRPDGYDAVFALECIECGAQLSDVELLRCEGCEKEIGVND